MSAAPSIPYPSPPPVSAGSAWAFPMTMFLICGMIGVRLYLFKQPRPTTPKAVPPSPPSSSKTTPPSNVKPTMAPVSFAPTLPLPVISSHVGKIDSLQADALDRALNDASEKYNKACAKPNLLSVRVASGQPKPGWCFVGTDNAFRICAPVGVNDRCTSGQFFPSQAICMNPSLNP